jgi:multiple sugar transport system substrate-binding protein
MKRSIRVLQIVLVCVALVIGFGSATAQTKSAKLSLWGGFPEMEPFYKWAATEYAKTHPGFELDVLTAPLREFEQKLSATIPSDTASDIIEISAYTNAKFISAGLIPPAPAKVKAFFDAPGRYSAFAKADISYDGKYYALPLFQGRTALFWNTKMFKEAGLPGAPKTFAQMAEYAKKLAKVENGNLVRSGHSLRLSGQGSGVAEKFWFTLFPMGGTIAEPGKEKGKYHAGYNNDAGRKALKFYIDAVHVDKWDSHTVQHDAQAFELEQTAMFFRESWVIGDIAKNAPNLQYDTAPVPSDVRWGRITNPVNLYVTRSSKNADAAWDFCMFLNEAKQLAWMLDNVGWLPARQDVDLGAVFAKKPQLKAFVMNDPKYNEFGYTIIPCFDEIMTKFAERLVAAYLDKSLANNPAGIAKTIEAAATETNDILKKAKLYSE